MIISSIFTALPHLAHNTRVSPYIINNYTPPPPPCNVILYSKTAPKRQFTHTPNNGIQDHTFIPHIKAYCLFRVTRKRPLAFSFLYPYLYFAKEITHEKI
jgi:hypothetical protein